MLLSDLQSKDIIDITDGRKIGSIIDISINNEGNIVELSIRKRKLIFFSNGIVKLKWKQIDKIGKDVILVNIEGK